MTSLHPKQKTEQIWRELSDQLRRFIQSRINSTADADDILQNVFLRIQQGLNDLRQSDRLEAWVYQITRNAITDYYRKKNPIPNDETSTIVSPAAEETENANAEIAVCIKSLIKQLPDDQQRAVSLYELEGIPQQNIADQESISLSGAKSRIQRGRKNLKTLLNDCCQFQFDTHGNILDYQTTQENCCKADNHSDCHGSTE